MHTGMGGFPGFYDGSNWILCRNAGGGGGGYAGGGGAGSLNLSANDAGRGGRGSSFINSTYAVATTGAWSDDTTGFNRDVSAYTNVGAGEVVLTFAAANSSSVTQQPSSGSVGAALPAQPKVTLQQAGAAASGVTVTAAIATKPTPSGSQIPAVLDGTTTATTDGSGVATFAGLSIRGPTGDYTLKFTAAGYPDATSNTFNLAVGTPSALSQITASPTSIQVANPGNTSVVTVQALDAGGNTITSGGATVSLAASTGSMGSVTNVGNGTYTASYTGTSVMGTTTVTGTINGIAILDTATVAQTVGAAAALSIATQPAAGASQSGVALATQPVVRIVDAFGNLTASTANVTATLTSGTGTLGGTVTVAAVAGVATFTNLAITGTASQSYVMTFSSGAFSQAVSNAFSLAKASQTISFGAAPSPTWSSGGTFAVSATATSTLPVTYSVDPSSSSVCSIADGAVGSVTMLTAGSCVVNANQSGNVDFLAAPQAQQTVSIAKANQTVSFTYTGGAKTFGSATFSVASMASATSGLTPTFTSSTTSVCTVDSSGTVTLVAQGTCTISASQPGDARYNAAAAVAQSFTVNRGTTSVSWAPTTAITVPQSPLTPSALASTPGNGPISYSIDDSTTTGCAVNVSTGVLTYTASGTCVVRATAAQTDQWISTFTTVTFVISKATQTITFPVIPGKVYGDGPFVVTVSAPSNNVILTSSTTAICTVAGTTVTIVRAGTCSLTASAAETAAYFAAPNATRTFAVSPASPSISWSPTLAITADDTRSFTPSALATSNGGAISYSVDSAGATGCTVNAATAVVSYVTAGSCAIRATSAATDDTASGFTVATFTISKASQSISFTAPGNMNYGDPAFLTSATTTAPGRIVTFTSLTPLVCGVTGAATPMAGATWATVSIVGVGTCSLRASQPGDDVYAPAAVQDRSFVVAQGTQAALVFTNSTSGVYDDTLTLATAGGSGTGTVTYALVGGAGTANCSLNTATGELTFGTAANGTGTCVVQATKASDTNFSSQSTANTTITVARAPQTVVFTSAVPSAPLPGDTYAITATATSGNSVTLAALGGCTLSAATAPATLTFNATGPCTVLANSAATTNYAAAYEESQLMTVGALSQTITTVSIADRAYGSAAFSIGASTSASSGLAVAYSSDDTSVCTASAAGIISTHAVGVCIIRMTQAGNAQYAPASPVLSVFNVFAVTPNRPFIFSASAGDAAISVAFSAPGFTGGAPVTAYRLVATPTGAGVSVSNDSCTGSPCTLSGLVNGTEYTLTVAGINSAGVGLASLPSGAVTPVTRAAAVANLTAVPSATSIALSWTRLTTAQLGGGAFVRYDIYHRPTGGSWPLLADDSLTGQTDDSLVITGLINGASYSIKVVAITTANSTELVGNTAIVFEYAATVPSAPTSVVGMKWTSDSSALISWSPPLSDGGRPVSAYAVTTSAGVGCTPSPATDDTCIVTGLPLGATISVSVRATNAVGTSSAGTTTYTTPGAPPGPTPGPGPVPPGPTPVPPAPPGPQPLPGPPPGPGEAEVIVDGKPVPGTTTTPGDGTVTIGGDDGSAGGGDFTLTLSAYMGNQRVPLGPGGMLTAPERSRIEVQGTGYAPNSRVSVYVGGSPLLLLGNITTTATGTFGVRLLLPASVTAGDYVLQINGYNVGAKVRSINVGLTVTKTPWIKIKGQRGVERVTVEGLSGEIIEGTTIYPMVKLGKSKRFVQGVGLRKLHADGSFEWQRKVTKGKPLWVYFTVMPVKSNTVALMAKTTRT